MQSCAPCRARPARGPKRASRSGRWEQRTIPVTQTLVVLQSSCLSPPKSWQSSGVGWGRASHLINARSRKFLTPLHERHASPGATADTASSRPPPSSSTAPTPPPHPPPPLPHLYKLRRVTFAARGRVSARHEEHDNSFALKRLSDVDSDGSFGAAFLHCGQFNEGAGGDCSADGNHVGVKR